MTRTGRTRFLVRRARQRRLTASRAANGSSRTTPSTPRSATRFGATIEQALAGGLREWDAQGPQGVLARILVLDQFTRNAYRNTPQSFAGDALALAAARGAGRQRRRPRAAAAAARLRLHAVRARRGRGACRSARSSCSRALAAEHPGFDEMLDYAHRHRGVIARFGRFPHRNEILGRASTPEEIEFLRQPGSRF